MSYQSFLPAHILGSSAPIRGSDQSTATVRDARDGLVYLIDKPLQLAIDTALATSRPLLLRGDPGSGKSSLAPYLARVLEWRYYEHVITSRTNALDLLWTFDSIRKLADASLGQSRSFQINDHDYVEPGVLWWAMAPDSAGRRGLAAGDDTRGIREPHEPNGVLNLTRMRDRAVVLIDEVDKADPDVPNGLLVPLGSSEFRVTEIDALITRETTLPDGAGSNILVIVTTNGERDLPPAFLRRCICHTLQPADRDRMYEIGRKHVSASLFLSERVSDEMLRGLATIITSLRVAADAQAVRAPSTAEYLDAVWACASLGIRTDDEEWAELQRLVLWKDGGV